MQPVRMSTSDITDVVVVLVLCFGWFILASIGAVATGFPSQQFDDSAFIAIIVSELVLGTAALAFLHYRGHALRPLVPIVTASGCLVGLALYAATVALTLPLNLVVGADQLAAQPIERMVHGAVISLPALVAVSVVNGAYEEIFLTGYVLPALESFGASFAIGTVMLVRVLYHLYQGPIGAISVLVVGAVLSVYFWRTRKLWPVVVAHILADLLGFAFS